MPWAEFPVTNLFGYQYRDGPNNEIKRPRIYLMYIDTEVVVDKNSPDYEDEKRRLRKMIENIRIKTSISGTINALPPLP
nr:hypothetical protein [Euryarchaeota archaeon]